MKLNWKKFFKSLNVIEWIELLLLLLVFLIGLMTIFKFLFIGKTTIEETPVGSYQCTGGLFKVCSGSSEVANYLGVK